MVKGSDQVWRTAATLKYRSREKSVEGVVRSADDGQREG